jgi:predicted dehydrogenase
MPVKLKVGVLGGGRGMGFIRGYQLMEETEVVAACDAVALRRQELEQAGVPRVYATYEDMLSDEKLDIVVVCSGAPYHPDQVVMALDMGCHVQSEVPASYDLEGCRKIVKAVKRTGLKYMMAENYHYAPYFALWKKWLQEGRLGQPICLEGEYIHDCRELHWHVVETGATISGSRLQQGQKAFPMWRSGHLYRHPINYVTHSLGPLLWLLEDRCISVSCMGAGPFTEPSEDMIDYQIALCNTAQGRLLRITCAFSLHSGGGKSWYSVYGTKGYMESARANGHMVRSFEEDGHNIVSVTDAEVDAIFPPEARDWGHGGGDYFLYQPFIDAILHDKPLELDVYRSMDYTLPGVLGVKSAEAGGAVQAVPDPRQPF